MSRNSKNIKCAIVVFSLGIPVARSKIRESGWEGELCTLLKSTSCNDLINIPHAPKWPQLAKSRTLSNNYDRNLNILEELHLQVLQLAV